MLVNEYKKLRSYIKMNQSSSNTTSDKHEPSYNSHLIFLLSLGQWLFLLQVLFQLKIYFCQQ